MKSKIELGILAGLILVLLTYIIFRDNKSINYDIPELTKYEKEDITSITYNEITFSSQNNQWFLPSGYTIEEDKIDRMLADAAGIKLIDMISDNKDYSRFGLDNPRTLKLSQNDKVLLEIKVGNKSNTGNYTFVKLPNRAEVYSVRGDIDLIFNKTDEDLRNKVVLTLNRESVTEVIIKTPKGERKITGEGLDTILSPLTNLNASTFNDLQKTEVEAEVEIIGETTKKLTIYKKVGEEYPAISTDVSFPFTLPSWIVSNYLDKE